MCSSCAPSSVTVTKRCSWVSRTRSVRRVIVEGLARVSLAAVSVVMSRQNSTASVPSGVPPLVLSCLPSLSVSRSSLFVSFAGAVDGLEVGQELTVGQLAEVAAVDVTGVSKGRGFAGVMKRHNFSGQRASHGVKKVHRHAGGTGMSACPSRVFKGRRMAGQYGNARVTVRNLKVYRVDEANNLLLVNGAVPGPNGGWLVIRETNKVG